MDFHQHSKAIVEDYLSTVTYVDDLIFSSRKEIQAVDLGKPDLRKAFAKLQQIQVPNNKADVPELQLVPNINPLHLTNAFLKKGIHCTLLEITNSDDPLDTIKKLLKKSDVVILDWQMHQDRGEKAKKLLISVLQESKKPELRLFIIFTNDPIYNTILEHEIIPVLNEIGINNIESDNTGCIAIFGHTKIIVLEKENGKKTGTSVSDEKLPERIIEELTEMTKGLISNVALKAISKLRQNTHYLLNTFNKNLDPAILTHRALLSDPTECEEHVISIISSEMLGLLHQNDVRDLISIDRIKLWINEQVLNGMGFHKKMKIRKKDDAISEILKILDKGIPNISPSKAINITWNKFLTILKHEKDKTKISDLTSIFSNRNDNIDEEFAILMSMKSNYQFLVPKLDQGTILKGDANANNQYFICIQPKCDCVRIKKSGEFFVFLPLLLVNNENRFDIIINEDGILRRLKIQQKPNLIEKYRFYPPKTGLPVLATQLHSNWHFAGNRIEDNNLIKVNFRFLGYLKQEYSQRVGNEYANSVSRIGFSESEWLRRWAK